MATQDCKQAVMLAVVGDPPNHIDDLEQLYLTSLGATSLQVNDQWLEVFKLNGATSDNWNTAALQMIQALGYTGTNLTDAWNWLWCVNGGIGPAPPSGPAFLAFTDVLGTFVPDVIDGIGNAVEGNVTTRYYPDDSVIYQPYGANAVGEVYWNGKWWVVGQEGMTNRLPFSNDLTNWTQNGGSSATFDQVGLTGAPNTASQAVCPSGGAFITRNAPDAIPANTDPITFVYYLEKGTGVTNCRWFATAGGGPQNFWIPIDLATGVVTNATAIIDTVVDDGNNWILYLELPNDNNTQLTAGTGLSTVTFNVMNAEIYVNATTEDVIKASPIFTVGAPAAIASTALVLDSANQDDTEGAWYVEVNSQAAQNIIDGFLNITGANFVATDGTNSSTQPWTADTDHKVGIAYGSSLMSIVVDGVAGTEVAYDGALLQGALDLFRTPQATGYMRDLRRYNTTYAAGLTLLIGETT